MLDGLVFGIARIDALGREAQEEIAAHFQARTWRACGSTTSSVVPGYVVDSRITSIPAWKCRAISWQEDTM